MNRRGFLGKLMGLFGGAAGAAVVKPEPPRVTLQAKEETVEITGPIMYHPNLFAISGATVCSTAAVPHQLVTLHRF